MEHSLTPLQAKLLESLKWFDHFCRENNLRYYAIGGTILGAMRHKGFIPWDDDVDVTMPLPDYQKFISLFEANNINPHLEVLYGVKKNAIIPCASQRPTGNHNTAYIADYMCDKIVQTRPESYMRFAAFL